MCAVSVDVRWTRLCLCKRSVTYSRKETERPAPVDGTCSRSLPAQNKRKCSFKPLQASYNYTTVLGTCYDNVIIVEYSSPNVILIMRIQIGTKVPIC